ncbi:Dam family site-specific DNA-(adenine-N6)-methyltransferase, partial [Candidatus Gracilibacteria bacterium]|nr:Dam family site-specific DNA-(adenine-N6)-methyltransferase [Candidatus Gracilibacteria bacterium]
MSSIALNSLDFSIKFGLDFHIVKSWWDHLNFANQEEARIFFEKNKDFIDAHPFAKWVGGKRQILPQLKKLFPSEFGDYHEPFLGGGAVFFNLQKKQSFLSDVNAELINTYKVIKDTPKELIKFLETCKYDKAFYTQIRAWDRVENWQESYSEVERAGRFIYLNRTCFNGLYRVNSIGQFNVPMGGYSNPDFVQKQNLLNVSKLLNETKARIELQSFDKVLKNAKKDDFV